MFAIDRDNGIRAYAGAGQDATPLAVGEMPIIDFEEFVKLSQLRNWSKEDITEVWNSFAGTPEFSDLKPQKQFKNRQYGLDKIWAAIQRLLEPEHAPEVGESRQTSAEVGETSENPTPKTMKPKKTPKPKAEKPRKTAAKAEKKPKAREKKSRQSDGTPRPGSHLETLIRMINRENGASITEIMVATGWTATHTVRGRISNLCSKGMKIESVKTDRGRVYRAIA